MTSHLKGVPHQQSAAKGSFASITAETAIASTLPSTEGMRISYGQITAVDHETGQVAVTMFREPDKGDLKVLQGKFLPLLTSLSEVHLLWGALRPGLACRIYWRGRDEPQQAVIEIIGDEDTTDFLNQPSTVNEVDTGPYKLLSGGMSV